MSGKATVKLTHADISLDSICGLVMPISALDGCTESHWIEVKDVFTQAADEAGFKAKLVSDSKSNVIIQKSIVQNLYQYPIVICDVSAKNANVMFELGLRVSFSKPTIVVKDDQTSYSFDTAPFRHIEYPRDMNHKKINRFIVDLAENIKEIVAADREGRHGSYLSTFAAIEEVTIETKTLPQGDFIVKSLEQIQLQIAEMRAKIEEIDSQKNRRLIKYDSSSHFDLVSDQRNVKVYTIYPDEGLIKDYDHLTSKMNALMANNVIKNYKIDTEKGRVYFTGLPGINSKDILDFVHGNR